MSQTTSAQQHTTISGLPVDAFYLADSLSNFNPALELGYPGEFPFTRGVIAGIAALKSPVTDTRALPGGHLIGLQCESGLVPSSVPASAH